MSTDQPLNQNAASPPMTCHVKTDRGLNDCYVTLFMSDARGLDATKRVLRFDTAADADSFLASLESAAACGRQELERHEDDHANTAVEHAGDGGNVAATPSCTPNCQPVPVVGDVMPVDIDIEAGCDEDGYFAIVHVDDNTHGSVSRCLAFGSEAELLRFLSRSETAGPGAVRQLRLSANDRRSIGSDVWAK